METNNDDKVNLYEVQQMEQFEYQELADSSKSQQQQDKGYTLWKIGIACLLALILFANVIILGMTGVILTHLNTQESCDTCTVTSNPNTVNNVSLANSMNCSSMVALISNCSDIVYSMWNDVGRNNTLLQTKVNQLIGTIGSTSMKINDISDSIDEEVIYTHNNTENIKNILKTTENSAQKLVNIISTLSNVKNITVSTSGIIDDIKIIVDQLLELQNGSSLFNSIRPVSCKDIKTTFPNSPSGYYHVNSRNIYCDMNELCGSGGGWTRLAYLDMSDATVNCPPGFRLYQSNGVRACGRPVGGASCVPVVFPSNGISYSQICGRVTGYQYASPDAVDTRFISLANHNNINSFYVDGVSITRGSPRQHVWTLMCGVRDSYPDAGNCPCSNPPGSTQSLQSFIGNHYFCESGNPNNGWSYTLYTGDPLWDGQGCGSQEQVCCAASGLPWFHRDYGNSNTTDYLELRLCADESTNVDDIPIGHYELYVK